MAAKPDPSSRFVVSAPCAKCPFRRKFRGADDYLRPGRRRGIIVDGMLDGGGIFPCHEHADGEGGGVQCAGAALVLLRSNRDNQMLRITERLGWDSTAFVERNAKVKLWTLTECLIDGKPERADEVTPCSVVDPGCLAPAGHMVNGRIERGTVDAELVCPCCDEAVCSNCVDARTGLCPACADWEAAERGLPVLPRGSRGAPRVTKVPPAQAAPPRQVSNG